MSLSKFLSIDLPFATAQESAIPIHLVQGGGAAGLDLAAVPALALPWVEANQFDGKPGQFLIVPGPTGGIACVLFGARKPHDPEPYPFGALSAALPAGTYEIASPLTAAEASAAAIGWAMGRYEFTRYREERRKGPARLVLPPAADLDHVRRTVEAVWLVRDLVNTPAGDLGPAELAEVAVQLASTHGAEVKVIVGDALLESGYPLVHAVGRAATLERAPRLIDLSWGDEEAPRLTLVGKGVCFDSGGLDLKPSSAMLLMKKDMGGAAHALGLAHMIMDAGLDLRLRVLIPAVENAVSSASFRPGDVYPSRKGLTVEIGNTDAEGRLILADALAEADDGRPDLLLDFATLTGAARVALGPDLPALYTPDDDLAEAILDHGRRVNDPSWRLPLWSPYDRWLDSRVADLNNVQDGSFAGSVVAALFLQRFVTQTKNWAHFDLFAWTPKPAPGRPVGGEAMTIRALYALIVDRFDL